MELELVGFPSPNASHRLIVLHGWGANAEDLFPLGQILVNDLEIEMELISLNAPHQVQNGFGRQWYNLFPADWTEAEKAINELENRLLKLDLSKIPFEKTVLLGFSQGGAMALSTGVRLPLAGLVGCSSYPHPGFLPPASTPPILLTHGTNDNVVPLNAALELLEIFNQKGTEIELKKFEGAHEIPQKVYSEISSFLEKCLQ